MLYYGESVADFPQRIMEISEKPTPAVSGKSVFLKEVEHETHSDIEHKKASEHDKEGRLRRVPDVLPVRLQDELHGRKPELRAKIANRSMVVPQAPFGACGRLSMSTHGISHFAGGTLFLCYV